LLENSKIFCGVFLYRLEIYQPINFFFWKIGLITSVPTYNRRSIHFLCCFSWVYDVGFYFSTNV